MRSWCLWVGRLSSLAGQHIGVEFVLVLSPTPQTGKSLGLLIKHGVASSSVRWINWRSK